MTLSATIIELEDCYQCAMIILICFNVAEGYYYSLINCYDYVLRLIICFNGIIERKNLVDNHLNCRTLAIHFIMVVNSVKIWWMNFRLSGCSWASLLKSYYLLLSYLGLVWSHRYFVEQNLDVQKENHRLQYYQKRNSLLLMIFIILAFNFY